MPTLSHLSPSRAASQDPPLRIPADSDVRSQVQRRELVSRPANGVGNDLPPEMVPLTELELQASWLQELVACSAMNYAAGTDRIPSSSRQSILWPRSVWYRGNGLPPQRKGEQVSVLDWKPDKKGKSGSGRGKKRYDCCSV